MATEEKKDLNQEVRDEIKKSVVVHTKDDDGEPVEVNEDEVKEEVKEPEKEETVIEAEADGETEDEEKEVEEIKEDDKSKRLKEKFDKRIAKATAKAKELERELAATKAKLEGKEEVLTKDDVERLAEEKANQKTLERQLINAANKLFDEAVKVDKNFKAKVDAMAEELGAIPGQMVGILEDLDNGGAVLNFLTDNTDEAETIYSLSPAKMALELKKISDKVKPKPKTVSKTPDPPKPLGGNAARTSGFNPADTKNTSDWIEKRTRDIAEKRAAGRINLR